jgi:hypothetical protein
MDNVQKYNRQKLLGFIRIAESRLYALSGITSKEPAASIFKM